MLARREVSKDAERQALVDDPRALKEFTGRVDAPSANSARMAVLHVRSEAQIGKASGSTDRSFDRTLSAICP